MQETNESRYSTGNPVCDALRFLCDASYAVLPRDAAHQLGEVQKNFWGGVRWLADKQVGWIDEALRRSDHLRDEWRRRYGSSSHTDDTPTFSASDAPQAEGL